MLARFRILTKILMVVGVLAVVALAITGVGVRSLGTLNTTAQMMNGVSEAALNGARLSVGITALSRGEYRIAIDPSEGTRNDIMGQVEVERVNFYKRLDLLAGALSDPADQERLTEIRALFDAYMAQLQATAKTAEEVQDQQVSEATVLLRDSAILGRAAAEAGRKSVAQLIGSLD